MSRQLFTSESVSMGHPDKMCDQVSDAILDAMLAQDPKSRVACETATTTGLVFVCGEVTTTARVEIPTIVRNVVHETTDPRGLDITSQRQQRVIRMAAVVNQIGESIGNDARDSPNCAISDQISQGEVAIEPTPIQGEKQGHVLTRGDNPIHFG